MPSVPTRRAESAGGLEGDGEVEEEEVEEEEEKEVVEEGRDAEEGAGLEPAVVRVERRIVESGGNLEIWK